MKTQKFIIFSLLLPLLFLSGCTAGDIYPGDQYITIGEYTFFFPPGYKHIEENGLDSAKGKITNGTMRFSYDYGFYGVSFGDLPANKYEFIEEELEGFSLNITRSLDHPRGYTMVYLYNIADYEANPFELNRLTLYSSGLTADEQQVAISVFRSVTIERLAD